MKHTLSDIIAQLESPSLASLSQKARNTKGKSSKGSKQSNAHYGAKYQPLNKPTQGKHSPSLRTKKSISQQVANSLDTNKACCSILQQ